MRGLLRAVAIAGAAAAAAHAGTGFEHVAPSANGAALTPAVSGTGRLVAFSSTATNLLRRVRSGQQLYVLDRATKRIELASVAARGVPGAGASTNPTFSADGRYVAFVSNAPNFVRGDHLFVSTNPPGAGAYDDVFVRDRVGHRTILASRARGGGAANGCTGAQISANGRYVVFASGSPKLVAGDTNQEVDVFVADIRTGAVRRVSTTAAGAQLRTRSDQATISGDGRLVAFHSIGAIPGGAEGIYVRDLRTGRVRFAGGGFAPSLSADGRVLAYAASDGVHAVVLATGANALVGPGASVVQPRVSRDGTVVVFERRNELDAARRGAVTNVVTVNAARTVELGGISANGRVVSFRTTDSLAPSDTDGDDDVYVRP